MRTASERVGRPVSRVEGFDKVTGRARYTADVDVPGLAHAVLVQTEIPHGRVTEESVRRAAEQVGSASGVLHVLTPLNCPALGQLPHELTFDLPLERRPPLSDLTVQHVGQHLAVVVADTLENAAAAASLFTVDYDVLPAQTTARAVLTEPAAPDEESGRIRHGSYLPDHFVKLDEEKLQDRRGEPPERGRSALRVDARYTTPVNAHYPIELSATIAEWNGEQLTVHDSTRWIAGERTALAAYLAIPEDRIRVLSPLVGGAFGSKSFLWMHVVLCAVAARAVGRPVKLVLTRDQMFTSTGHRPRTEQDVRLIADEDGTIVSTEHHTLTETSTVAHFCEPAGLSTRILYTSPHLVVSHRTARINAPTPCFMRGPGEAPGLFALEVAIDELAERARIDPLELRIRNHANADQAGGKPWSGKHLLQCYQEGAERFGWKDRPAAPRSLQRAGVQVGWGMSTATYPGRRMPAGCRVVTDADGHVEFSSATHEVGNGVRTVMTQVAADTAGLPIDRVSFLSGDSAFPAAPYSGASQTTATVGSAVFAAADEWRRRFIAALVDDADSPLFGADPATVDIGTVDPRVAAAYRERLSFSTSSDSGDQSTQAVQSFGAHFCEVEVDEQIGRASVTRWVAVMDCGRVLNPTLARNQVMGGITFGLGMALLEQVPYDDATALPLGEYYLPTHADRPDFDISFLDHPDFHLDPIGVRGIGEIGTCGVPAAVANAIHHATGKRLRDLPITLEDLMIPFEQPGGAA
ncbi:xanthine dehydrogenase family protein molybdopterin-binding subunit [Mycolicibacterium sp. OfavD-34-C]|uniref:xanthine dehydrogenase family protein molybdopterin-binding subunit n=1 Tax=Mycolicibacterium sp. OfavD-34-C TaxID=2917746 RepID=UPI001EF6F119|nr:xanthine dehydrogenase family protein molybdopterin-binding subunit [Mycolicibacterium sp. OfavD-34-C]MCG7583579.1 xanthine dehydrogenase family protein molybdopterin-binding subunit [Mycolicibacterium sp. OfavD-34-C]